MKKEAKVRITRKIGLRVENWFNEMVMLYDLFGYAVMEVELPLEFREAFGKIPRIRKKDKVKLRDGIDVYQSDAGITKIFPSQSRHLHVFIG